VFCVVGYLLSVYQHAWASAGGGAGGGGGGGGGLDEPCPRGSAERPSPCGSGHFNFPSLRSPFPGCCPRIDCREWVEGGLPPTCVIRPALLQSTTTL